MNRTVAVLCMGGRGHVQPLLAIVRGLVDRRCRVVALSREEFRDRFERAGAEFADLYGGRPLDAADATSVPLPVRFVAFAAVWADSLAADLATRGVDLVVHDTFTVVAPVVARRLGIACVNLCPNHALVPSRALAGLRTDPRVSISPDCERAVETLRSREGMPGAGPFAWATALSPFLNLYPEPAEFLPPEDRAELEPLEFVSLLPGAAALGETRATGEARAGRARPVAYVAFGSGVLRYFEKAATEAFDAATRTLVDRGFDVTIGLGGQALAAAARAALERRGARVLDDADQWSLLGSADLFVTHHGLNSTHEAIYRGVPMLSCPFLGDQPALARRCQELGLAVPITDAPAGPVAPDRLRRAIEQIVAERPAFEERLRVARGWEERTLARLPLVVDRVLEQIGRPWPATEGSGRRGR